jgi:hypothetical protein
MLTSDKMIFSFVSYSIMHFTYFAIKGPHLSYQIMCNIRAAGGTDQNPVSVLEFILRCFISLLPSASDNMLII